MPAIVAPGLPAMINGLSMVIGPAYSPGSSVMTSPAAALEMMSCNGGEAGETISSAAAAMAGMAARTAAIPSLVVK